MTRITLYADEAGVGATDKVLTRLLYSPTRHKRRHALDSAQLKRRRKGAPRFTGPANCVPRNE
jgi:hypothetical protein